MGNRFVDNVTPLDAATLNKFEEDMKHCASIPVYEAVRDISADAFNCMVYRIADVEWTDIPVGGLFSVSLDESTESDTEHIVGFCFGPTNKSIKYLFYSTPDYKMTFAVTQYVQSGSRKYLLAHRPYTLKKLAETGSSTPLLTLIDHFETAKFGTSLGVSDGKLTLKNLDGAVIGEIELPKASQSVSGSVKAWLSGTTLNISTE